MSEQSSAKVVTESTLKLFGTRVRDMCNNLNPDLITEHSAPSMKERLKEIGGARDEFRNSVRKLLNDFDMELSGPEKEQWNADMKTVVDQVNGHKFRVLGKVNQLTLPTAPMRWSEQGFEKATIHLKTQLVALQNQAIVLGVQQVGSLAGHHLFVNAEPLLPIRGSQQASGQFEPILVHTVPLPTVQQVGGHAVPLQPAHAALSPVVVGQQAGVQARPHIYIHAAPIPGGQQEGGQSGHIHSVYEEKLPLVPCVKQVGGQV